MKKRIRIIFLLTVLSMILCGCKRGKVNGVNLVIGDSSIYTKDELKDAMKVVTDTFKENFKGCTLTELSYDETRSVTESGTWKDSYGTDDVIVLYSSFDVDASGGDGSLDPNSTYDNWMWVLSRNDKGKWALRTNGY